MISRPTFTNWPWISIFALPVIAPLISNQTWPAPLTTAFTYQGRLVDGAGSATGHYEFRFGLYNAEAAGSQVDNLPTNVNVAVSNGLFTTSVDFGAGIFGGTAYLLELGVRTNGSLAAFNTLAPRQPLTATPYALFSPAAGTAGTVASDGVDGPSIRNGAISASKIAGGQLVKSLNSLRDDVVLSVQAPLNLATNGNILALSEISADWSLSGNSGTSGGEFLGTIDNKPLELRVDNARVLRLE